MSTGDLDLGIAGYVDAVEIAHGGFGTVYRARQPKFSRTVAVKVLPFRPDAHIQERFERECKAIGSLSGHPNIATVFDAGVTRAGHLFLAMEYAPHGTLADRVRRDGGLAWQEAVEIGIKLAGAVETAHRGGVLHRDIKPENVLVSEYGEPRLTDFGLARLSGYESASQGGVAASVPHAPPEVLGGRGASVTSDVYSLASTIATLILGRPPFSGLAGDDLMAIIGRIATQPPPDLSLAGVPAAITGVIERALAKDPSDRLASAAQLGRALQHTQRDAGVATTAMPLLDAEAIAAAPVATDELEQTGDLGREGATRMFMREGRTPPADRTTEPVLRAGPLDAPSILRGDFDRPAASAPAAPDASTHAPPVPNRSPADAPLVSDRVSAADRATAPPIHRRDATEPHPKRRRRLSRRVLIVGGVAAPLVAVAALLATGGLPFTEAPLAEARSLKGGPAQRYELAPNDTVAVSRAGLVEIAHRDGALTRLDSEARMVISTLADRPYRFGAKLESGRMWAQTGPESTYVIDSNYGSFRVFGVAVVDCARDSTASDGKTTIKGNCAVAVLEGRVTVREPTRNAQSVDEGRWLRIPSDPAASATFGAAPLAPDQRASDPWIKENVRLSGRDLRLPARSGLGGATVAGTWDATVVMRERFGQDAWIGDSGRVKFSIIPECARSPCFMALHLATVPCSGRYCRPVGLAPLFFDGEKYFAIFAPQAPRCALPSRESWRLELRPEKVEEGGEGSFAVSLTGTQTEEHKAFSVASTTCPHSSVQRDIEATLVR